MSVYANVSKTKTWIRKNHLVWVILLAATLFLTRGLALDRYVSLDEVSWLRRSANFYYALGQRDFVQTRASVDPAVTTMWVNTAAFLIDAPQYRGYGQGYFEDFSAFDNFVRSRDIDPHQVLVTARYLMLAENIILLVAAFILSIRLIGLVPAFAGFMLVALDPFHIEWTTVSHTDGQLSCLMILAIVSFLYYFMVKPKAIYLLISAVTTSLALLTKLPGYLLFVFFAGFLVYEFFWKRRRALPNHKKALNDWFRRSALHMGVWLATVIIVYVAVWPAMWVEPIQTFSRQITAPFIFVDREEMLSPSTDNSNTIEVILPEKVPGVFQRLLKYPAVVLWRSTPVTLLGLVLFLVLIFRKSGFLREPGIREIALIISIFIIIFLAFLSLAQMHNMRYMMPAVILIDIIAALGWVSFIKTILSLNKLNLRLAAIAAVVIFIAAFQVAAVIKAYPYYGSYHNPIMGGEKKANETLFIGSGEGLDEAGRYLSAKPGAEEMTVLSWYGNGCFSYYFSGRTINLPVILKDAYIAANIADADYIVVYTNQWRRNRTPRLFAILAQAEPEHSIWFNGIEYARIYKVDDLPTDIYTY